MLLRKVVQALERIERGQEEIIRLLRDKGRTAAESDVPAAEGSDKWIQDGIDSILSFQAGKKREADQ